MRTQVALTGHHPPREAGRVLPSSQESRAIQSPGRPARTPRSTATRVQRMSSSAPRDHSAFPAFAYRAPRFRCFGVSARPHHERILDDFEKDVRRRCRSCGLRPRRRGGRNRRRLGDEGVDNDDDDDSSTTAKAGHTPETALTGDVAAKAKAAAVAKVGGTADTATTENDNSNSAAAYEVHVTKADGSRVTVILDSSYAVLTVETGQPHGGPGHHGPGGPNGGNGETALTGEVATQAKAAAVAKVGGTADRATTENDSSDAAAAYEVHLTKTDGSHVVVILDKSFGVLTVDTGPSGGPHGDGPHGDGGHNGFRR